MGRMSSCIVCELAYGAEEVVPGGIKKLKKFKGYTVDLRLQQFRKVPYSKLPEFIDFDSPKGLELLAQMHDRAIELANKRISRIRRLQKKK